MCVPTLSDLHETFLSFQNATYDGIPGVMCIEGREPGPTLGITACTHGNEPSGLAMFAYLLTEKDIRNTLQRGTLYLVVNNIAAAERYFAATTADGKKSARYCDINMNRLPKDMPQRPDDGRYEVRRAQELYPIWERFQYGLDVHSTTDYDPPMIISRGGQFHSELVRCLPISTLISNIDGVQIGLPPFAFYGGIGGQAPVFAIEAGQHEDPETFYRAKTCVESLLQSLGMRQGTLGAEVREYEEYCVDDSVMFPDMSYEFVRSFNHLDKVATGQILARSDTSRAEIRAPFDGVLIMPSPRRGLKKDIKEEQAFLSRPMKIRRV